MSYAPQGNPSYEEARRGPLPPMQQPGMPAPYGRAAYAAGPSQRGRTGVAVGLFYATFLLSLLVVVFQQFFALRLMAPSSPETFGLLMIFVQVSAAAVHLALALTAVWLLPAASGGGGAHRRRQWIATAMIVGGSAVRLVYGTVGTSLVMSLVSTVEVEILMAISSSLAVLVDFAVTALLLAAWLLVRNRTRGGYILMGAGLVFFLLVRIVVIWTTGSPAESPALQWFGRGLALVLPLFTAGLLALSELLGRRRQEGPTAPGFPAPGQSTMPGQVPTQTQAPAPARGAGHRPAPASGQGPTGRTGPPSSGPGGTSNPNWADPTWRP